MPQPLKNIYRSAGDKGYIVHLIWDHKIYHEFFADKDYGGKRAAFNMAVVYRAVQEAIIHKPRTEGYVRVKKATRAWRKNKDIKDLLNHKK